MVHRGNRTRTPGMPWFVYSATAKTTPAILDPMYYTTIKGPILMFSLSQGPLIAPAGGRGRQMEMWKILTPRKAMEEACAAATLEEAAAQAPAEEEPMKKKRKRPTLADMMMSDDEEAPVTPKEKAAEAVPENPLALVMSDEAPAEAAESLGGADGSCDQRNKKRLHSREKREADAAELLEAHKLATAADKAAVAAAEAARRACNALRKVQKRLGITQTQFVNYPKQQQKAHGQPQKVRGGISYINSIPLGMRIRMLWLVDDDLVECTGTIKAKTDIVVEKDTRYPDQGKYDFHLEFEDGTYKMSLTDPRHRYRPNKCLEREGDWCLEDKK
jgi:hypothetical protein